MQTHVDHRETDPKEARRKSAPNETDSEHMFKGLLHAYGLKATPARLGILETLSKERDPLSAIAIHAAMPRGCGYVTIYRALESMAEMGMVSKIDFSHDHAHYELAVGREHHHHAVCISCGDIEDISGCDAADLNASARSHLKKFAAIQSHSLEFFGLCRMCETKAG